ncbi:hypothetical protein NL676_005939 [Syzygium grande]|nr:hypothetical protein NL676_005939 [Syzygium grande]
MDGMSMSNMGHKSYTQHDILLGEKLRDPLHWVAWDTDLHVRAGLDRHLCAQIPHRVDLSLQAYRRWLEVAPHVRRYPADLMHATRTRHAYLLMLALMSFNVGVLIVAILGHGVGFFFFGSRAFKKTPPPGKVSTDLPPMNC